MATDGTSDDAVRATCDRLAREAEQSGYHLNPDEGMTLDLVKGLLANESRYGYRACPCRLASGDKDEDLDIICPCDYRDSDLDEFGCCYCSLYVSAEVVSGEKQIGPIPERRPRAGGLGKPALKATGASSTQTGPSVAFPVWRCRVCGYLCARDGPPETCPICKAGKERFERFM